MPLIASSDVVDEVYYPSEDEKKMAETHTHLLAMLYLFDAMNELLQESSEVYVAMDLFWYWEKGDPSACSAPDLMVIQGVGKHCRDTFKSWEENGAIPSVIFEIASSSTWRERLTEDRQNYERLEVPEYFVFDPQRSFLKTSLVGFRLGEKSYDAVAAELDGSMTCKSLNIQLIPEGEMLRIKNLETGQFILTAAERQEKERVRAEAEHRLALEARELAKAERLRVVEKDRLLSAERLRAEASEAEVLRLKAQIEALIKKPAE